MLETKDIQAIFSHIKDLHPHCPPDKVPRLTNALANSWINALAGYSKEQVLKAADAHANSCRYWPSLSEIVQQLPPLSNSERMRHEPPGPVERRHMAVLLEWQEEWHKELKNLGLPTFREAVSSGMSPGEWRTALEAAGVWA